MCSYYDQLNAVEGKLPIAENQVALKKTMFLFIIDVVAVVASHFCAHHLLLVSVDHLHVLLCWPHSAIADLVRSHLCRFRR